MPRLCKPIYLGLCLAFALCFAAPSAKADTVTYTFDQTDPGQYDVTWTTVPLAAVTMDTFLPLSDLTSENVSGPFLAGCAISFVELDALGGIIFTNFAPSPSCNVIKTFSFVYPASDYTTPGTYILTGAGTAVVTTLTVQTPEPSSLALMLAGMGLVLVMRKR